MGGQPPSINGSDRNDDLHPQGGTGRNQVGDLTIDFTPQQSALGPQPPTLPIRTGYDSGFFEPARAPGEIGWLANYKVLKLLGVGGMGLVYLAEDTQLARPVALKVIRPELATSAEAAARFTREARAAAAISHDNVVRIYQVGETGGVAFLAMEYLQGVSLQDWLDKGKKPSVDLVLRIGREVAAGLIAAHKLGLIHRDIKPANIWLEAPNGRVKILDFGQARTEREDVQITQSGAIVGTPAFMSPEQAVGEPTSPASDLFCLGSVLYRLCCGRLAFEGNTILAMLSALANKTPTPPIEIIPEIPPELSALISKLLEKRAEDRPESAQVVYESLRAIERQLAAKRQGIDLTVKTALIPPKVIKQTPVVKPAPQTRRYMPVAGAALVGLIVATFAWFSRNPPKKESGIPAQTAPTEIAKAKAFENAPLEAVNPPNRSVPLPGMADPEAAPEIVIAQNEPPALAKQAAVEPPLNPQAPNPPASPEPPVATITKRAAAVVPAQELTRDIFGKFIDPDGDCKLVKDDEKGSAILEIPGTAHAMSVETKRLNAPRTLRPITGPFKIQARVSGTDKVAGRATTKEFSPYHGGGILVWQDKGNYVRLEIATEIYRGKVRHYANFEYRNDYKLAFTRGQLADSGTADLSLERQGNEITAKFSTDGTEWFKFPVLNVDLPEDINIGIIGINTASRPMSLKIDHFRVDLEKSKAEAGTP